MNRKIRVERQALELDTTWNGEPLLTNDTTDLGDAQLAGIENFVLLLGVQV